MLHKELIEKVREGISGRNEVITYLIRDKEIRKGLLGTLINKGCLQEEAEMHFTDAVLIFVKACLKPDFQITSSRKNYLIGIALNLFRKEVTKSSKDRQLDDKQTVSDNETPLSLLMRKELHDPLRKLLDKIDEKCRKVLVLWAQRQKMVRIAEEMNYKSEGMARKKKHQCVRKMYNIINENPGLKDRLRDML